MVTIMYFQMFTKLCWRRPKLSLWRFRTSVTSHNGPNRKRIQRLSHSLSPPDTKKPRQAWFFYIYCKSRNENPIEGSTNRQERCTAGGTAVVARAGARGKSLSLRHI